MPSGYAAQNFREKRREVAPPQVAPRVILSEVELWRLADKARDVPSKRNLRGPAQDDTQPYCEATFQAVGATIGRPRWQTVRGTVWRSALLRRRGDSRIARYDGVKRFFIKIAYRGKAKNRFQHQICWLSGDQ